MPGFTADDFVFLASVKRQGAQESTDRTRLLGFIDTLENSCPEEVEAWAEVSEFRAFAAQHLNITCSNTRHGHKINRDSFLVWQDMGNFVARKLGARGAIFDPGW
ncbi:hypothetical protein F66182_6822 [Fusarium sp. NRRL 66182]|nr:hypothetical protein F66182_6822 [Fusarium sp. NRRL 66182]